MFTTQSTTDRIDNNSFVTNNGATVMLYKSISTKNRIATLAAVIAVAAIALFAGSVPASADNNSVPNYAPLAEFRAITTDAPYTVSMKEAWQGGASVINLAAFYADTTDAPTVTNVWDDGPVSRIIAKFTSLSTLTTDAPYTVSMKEAWQGGASVINLAAFYAGTMDAPEVG